MTTEPIDRDQGDLYLTFTMPIDWHVAVEAFEAKFGYKPDDSFNWLNKYLMVGPVKEDKDEQV